MRTTWTPTSQFQIQSPVTRASTAPNGRNTHTDGHQCHRRHRRLVPLSRAATSRRPSRRQPSIVHIRSPPVTPPRHQQQAGGRSSSPLLIRTSYSAPTQPCHGPVVLTSSHRKRPNTGSLYYNNKHRLKEMLPNRQGSLLTRRYQTSAETRISDCPQAISHTASSRRSLVGSARQ